ELGAQRSPQDRAQEAGGRVLLQRLVAVAAFGGLDAGGAAADALAGSDRLARRGLPCGERLEAALGEAGTAVLAVVDEVRRHTRVRVTRGRDARDVPAVAPGEQRQQADGRVFGRVDGAGQFRGVDVRLLDQRVRGRPPDGGGREDLCGQLQ